MAKADLHPTWYPDAQVVCQCGNTWTTGATVPEIRTEICSNCHPFYTGEQRIVDTEGRVDKFMKRLQRRDNIREAQESAAAAPTVPLDLPVAELGLNARFQHLLEENNINVAGDILRVLQEEGEDGLLGISGIGKQALIDIKKSMRAQGFELPASE